MGYLIVYVKPAHQTDSSDGRPYSKPLLELSVRAALGDSSIVGRGWPRLVELLKKHGFEPVMEIARVDPRLYPLVCIAYTSRNKNGEGRSGSSLYRFPCRKLE